MLNYRPVSHMLGSAGNDSTTGMAVDGSSGIEYYVTPTTGESWDIHHLSIELLDEKNFQAETFGVETALTNGILIYVKDADGDIQYYITPSGHAIKSNSDLAFFSETATTKQFTMTTNESATFHIDFNDRFGFPIRLDTGMKLVAKIQDSLTGLLELEMIATGRNLSVVD